MKQSHPQVYTQAQNPYFEKIGDAEAASIFCEKNPINCKKNVTLRKKVKPVLYLRLARGFWATKVCLRESQISKICLFGRPTGQATS